jgi:uncharacterized membrane protein YkoI
VWSGVAFGAEPATPMPLAQVPAAARKAIQDQAAGAKLGAIERGDEDGEVTFTATVTRNGQERDFIVAEDGSLISVEVTLAEVPAAAQKAIQGQLGSWTLDRIEKNLEENEVSYEVDCSKKDGKERFFSVTAEGKLLTLQMGIEEVPAAVRKAIDANLGKGKLGDIYRLSEGGSISYDAEVTYGGKVRDLVFGENGNLESVQVSLEEIPVPVQRTIREKVGAGKVVRIDKSCEARQGVQPFEVTARKDGKPFNFSVGPRGRFLGMDD